MIELFIGRYLANATSVEPPKMQEWPTCAMSAVFECETRKTWKVTDTMEVRTSSPWDWLDGSYPFDVLDRLTENSYIRWWDFITRRHAKKWLENWGVHPLVIYNYKVEWWFIVPREDERTNWHFACAVWYINNHYIIRNSRGESWLNWYFLAKDDVVGRIYDVAYQNNGIKQN